MSEKYVRQTLARKYIKRFFRHRDNIKKLVKKIEVGSLLAITEFASLHAKLIETKVILARDFRFYPDRSIYDEPLAAILDDRENRRGTPYGPPIKA